MDIYNRLDDLRLRRSCIAIGVFDGVHRGHQEVLRRTRDAAQIQKGTSLVLTFDRHPAEVIAPRYAPLALSSLSQRLEWIEQTSGVDAALVLPFSLEFANLSAQDFVKRVLVGALDARQIFVGADFRYGKDRHGGVMNLEAAGEQDGFQVQVIHSVSDQGERVSSTRVRTQVTEGDVQEAETLLGRPFTMRGVVVAGKQLGRTIGFPTANVAPEHPRQLLPASGIYAGYACLPREQFSSWHVPAAISVGYNPTTDAGSRTRKVEAYLLGGFNADLYGMTVDLEFIERLRDEEKYESLDDLKAQIDRDVTSTTAILKQRDNAQPIRG